MAPLMPRPPSVVLALAAFAAVLSSTRSGRDTVRWVGYTSMWYFGYFFSSARVPAVSMASYLPMFDALMLTRGCSDAKGSGRIEVPALKLAGAVVRPPV